VGGPDSDTRTKITFIGTLWVSFASILSTPIPAGLKFWHPFPKRLGKPKKGKEGIGK
jgi:hypothetical protein